MFLPTLEAVSKNFMVMGMVRASLFRKPTTNHIIENVPGYFPFDVLFLLHLLEVKKEEKNK